MNIHLKCIRSETSQTSKTICTYKIEVQHYTIVDLYYSLMQQNGGIQNKYSIFITNTIFESNCQKIRKSFCPEISKSKSFPPLWFPNDDEQKFLTLQISVC